MTLTQQSWCIATTFFTPDNDHRSKLGAELTTTENHLRKTEHKDFWHDTMESVLPFSTQWRVEIPSLISGVRKGMRAGAESLRARRSSEMRLTWVFPCLVSQLLEGSCD